MTDLPRRLAGTELLPETPVDHRWHHELGQPCPLMGGPPITSCFSDHSRPGVFYNACSRCHDDQRSIGRRLRDLETSRKRGAA